MKKLLTIGKGLGLVGWDFLTVGILAISALGIGLGVNAVRSKPLPLFYKTKAERLQAEIGHLGKGQIPASESAGISAAMSLEEFRSFVENGKGWVVDARPEIFHRFGHVPGALSLPREDFEAGYGRIRGKLEADKTKPIAVYCSDISCEDSGLVEKALRRLGHSQVVVFRGGWNTWTQAGLKEEK